MCSKIKPRSSSAAVTISSESVDDDDSGDDDIGNDDNKKVYNWNGSAGWCCVCRVWFTSTELAQQHLSGRRHKTAVDVWKSRRTLKLPSITRAGSSGIVAKLLLMRASRVKSLHCNVCYKNVNSTEQLELHKQSPRHLKMAARKPWLSIIASGGVPGDNTDWKTCLTCGKRVNSDDQLRAHEASHGIASSLPALSYTGISTSPKAEIDLFKGSTSTNPSSRDFVALSGERKRCPAIEPDYRAVKRFRSDSFTDSCCSNADKNADCWSHDDLASNKCVSVYKSERMDANGQKTVWPFGPQYRYYCELCMVPFNTLEIEREHKNGQKHMDKVLKQETAPDRFMPDVSTRHERDDIRDTDDHIMLTKTKPRPYQTELFRKSMKGDCVCFLPTGLE